jgi:hypothetical protein
MLLLPEKPAEAHHLAIRPTRVLGSLCSLLQKQLCSSPDHTECMPSHHTLCKQGHRCYCATIRKPAAVNKLHFKMPAGDHAYPLQLNGKVRYCMALLRSPADGSSKIAMDMKCTTAWRHMTRCLIASEFSLLSYALSVMTTPGSMQSDCTTWLHLLSLQTTSSPNDWETAPLSLP